MICQESSDEDVTRLDKEGLKRKIRVERKRLQDHEKIAQDRAHIGKNKITEVNMIDSSSKAVLLNV